jgi:riboflavin kinase / FMN adenylyltransferase
MTRSVVTIGNFDGPHLGHLALFDRVVDLANQLSAVPTVLSFQPHPLKILAPERAPKLLSTQQQREAVMTNAGIERIHYQEFDREFSRWTAEEFVERILVNQLCAKAVIVGDNFRFGHQQQGNWATLQQLGRRFQFQVEAAPLTRIGSQVISSSLVRQEISKGRVSMARRLLGRPTQLQGDIVSGHGIGRKETVPTLNLATENELLPQNGVYVSETTCAKSLRRWPSITNIGIRPTFSGDAITVETFLMEPLVAPTPSRILLDLFHFVRSERKFDSPVELKAQILADVVCARRWFHLRSLLQGITRIDRPMSASG